MELGPCDHRSERGKLLKGRAWAKAKINPEYHYPFRHSKPFYLLPSHNLQGRVPRRPAPCYLANSAPSQKSPPRQIARFPRSINIGRFGPCLDRNCQLSNHSRSRIFATYERGQGHSNKGLGNVFSCTWLPCIVRRTLPSTLFPNRHMTLTKFRMGQKKRLDYFNTVPSLCFFCGFQESESTINVTCLKSEYSSSGELKVVRFGGDDHSFPIGSLILPSVSMKSRRFCRPLSWQRTLRRVLLSSRRWFLFYAAKINKVH
jgi:hypothetical protein